MCVYNYLLKHESLNNNCNQKYHYNVILPENFNSQLTVCF